MIIKLKSGKFQLMSKKTHKNLGIFDTRTAAESRERQVQYFKHKNKKFEKK